VPHGFYDVASAGLSLGPNHGGALSNAAQGFAQVAATANEWHFEIIFPNMVAFIGWRQHL
jgi:citrate synthase